MLSDEMQRRKLGQRAVSPAKPGIGLPAAACVTMLPAMFVVSEAACSLGSPTTFRIGGMPLLDWCVPTKGTTTVGRAFSRAHQCFRRLRVQSTTWTNCYNVLTATTLT
jgi:hypothetical protein